MAAKTGKKQSYEQNFQRLEAISAALEEGSLPLEEALKLFEEGTRLATELHATLVAAEQKITGLTAEDDDAPADLFS
ncbi:MAG: exodeoxyribonuclease VII small subunit [Oscillospiraceae bacterium]|jgi:exodeoxyribonuclease VII small subunit|nr:exodeoxyribonuclease VII small subunit [Oscillospiraceae bacterium]